MDINMDINLTHLNTNNKLHQKPTVLVDTLLKLAEKFAHDGNVCLNVLLLLARVERIHALTARKTCIY